MTQDSIKQKMELLDVKNEIENLKLTISGIRLSIARSKNKNQTAKLKGKEYAFSKRLKDLCDKKKRLEREYALVCKTEGRYTL